MKLIGTFALTSLCVGLTNCSLVYSVERYGIKATMIDAESKQPIARHETRIVVDGAAYESRSDNRGAVSLRPDRRLHWSWLGGPIWMNDPETAIEIGPSGYQPLRIKWQPHLPAKTAGAEMPRFSEDGGVVDLGVLEMRLP